MLPYAPGQMPVSGSVMAWLLRTSLPVRIAKSNPY
jgi:hypothetical protein